MKICRYWQPGAGPRIGLIDQDRVFDLTSHDPASFGSFTTLIHLEDAAAEVMRALTLLKASHVLPDLDIEPDPDKPHMLAPIDLQEVWAAGVTYLRSRDARMEESPQGGSFYDKVYCADRPELFFKGTPNRVSGPNARVRIRADATWSVPEPELALILNSRRRLVGFTVGNDMSSRDIEGENPLYLPQAKVYQGSCALGPAMTLAESIADPRSIAIRLVIRRAGAICFEGETSIAQMKRSLDDLIAYLFREQEFPSGVILLTGAGVVPPGTFTLQKGDLIEITVPEIGTLRNVVA